MKTYPIITFIKEEIMHPSEQLRQVEERLEQLDREIQELRTHPPTDNDYSTGAAEEYEDYVQSLEKEWQELDTLRRQLAEL
jgi:chromosome segregation ATPase